MSKPKQVVVVTDDGRKVGEDLIRKLVRVQLDRLNTKDKIVADLRDGYDSAERSGLNKRVFKRAIADEKKGIPIEEAMEEAILYFQYRRALGHKVQLDLFSRIEEPVFGAPTDPVYADKQPTLEAEGPNESAEEGEAGQEEIPAAAEAEATDVSSEQPAELEEAETVVGRPKKDDGVESVSPEERLKARLEGEAAGRKGKPRTENPYPFSDPRHGFWQKGWAPEFQKFNEENPGAAAAETSRKRRNGRGAPAPAPQPRKPPMSARQAAALLGGPTKH
jgi:uncharacterized protein (UPF0335 family)